MNFEEILNVSIRIEDSEQQRKARWKSVHFLHQTINREPFNKLSFDNAIFSNTSFVVDADFFVFNLIKFYKFPNQLNMDQHLRYLFYTYDHERRNSVDWRDILIAYKILFYFRFVRDRPLDLILELFVVYSDEKQFDSLNADIAVTLKQHEVSDLSQSTTHELDSLNSSQKESLVSLHSQSAGEGSSNRIKTDMKDILSLSNAEEYIKRILFAPCLSDTEVVTINEVAYDLFERIKDQGNQVTRKELRKLFQTIPKGKAILQLWSRFAWERLSSDMRLTVMDEALLHHRDNAEVIIGRYKLSQALALYTRNTFKTVFRAWKLQTIRASGARAYAVRKMKR